MINQISTIRKEIDAIDSQLLELFLKRYLLVDEVGKIKNLKNSKKSIISGEREKSMLANILKEYDAKIKDYNFDDSAKLRENIFLLFRAIISAGISLEQNSEVLLINEEGLINTVAKVFGGFIPLKLFSNYADLFAYHQKAKHNTIIAQKTGENNNTSVSKFFEYEGLEFFTTL